MAKPLIPFIRPPYTGPQSNPAGPWTLNIPFGATLPTAFSDGPAEFILLETSSAVSSSAVSSSDPPLDALFAVSSGKLTVAPSGNPTLKNVSGSNSFADLDNVDLILDPRPGLDLEDGFSLHLKSIAGALVGQKSTPQSGDEKSKLSGVADRGGPVTGFLYLNVNIASIRAALGPLLDATTFPSPTSQAKRDARFESFLNGQGVVVPQGTLIGRAGEAVTSTRNAQERRQVGFAVLTQQGVVDPGRFFNEMRRFVEGGAEFEGFIQLISPPVTSQQAPAVSDVNELTLNNHRVREIIRTRNGVRKHEVGVLLFDFDVDDDVLKPEHEAQLFELAENFMKVGADIEVLQIVGHASQTGGEKNNKELSFRRAKVVHAFMKDLNLTLPEPTATGSRPPVVDYPNVEEALNRSVEIIYLWTPPIDDRPSISVGTDKRTEQWNISLDASLGQGVGEFFGGTLAKGTLTKRNSGEQKSIVVIAGGVDLGFSFDIPGDPSVDLPSNVTFGEQGDFNTFEPVDFDFFNLRPITLAEGGIDVVVGGSVTEIVMDTFFNGRLRRIRTKSASVSLGPKIGIGISVFVGLLNVIE